jgi:hypothetical protein
VLIEIDDDVINDIDLLDEVYTQLKAFRTKHKVEYSSYVRIIKNKNVPNNLKEGIKALFQQTSNLLRFKNSIRVVTKVNHENEALTIDLNEVLSTKAMVILENEHQDLRFIQIALEVVSHGPDLNRYYNKLWIARGAGGCGEIPKLIKKCKQEQIDITRLLVVYDSDKYKESHIPEIAQQNIEKTVEESNALHVMLSKREIENYIPIKVLEKIYSPEYPKISYFNSWSREQKDFFDVKLGFHKKCRHDDARYGQLYRDLDPMHISVFEKGGFGDDIAEKAFDMINKEEFKQTNLSFVEKDILNDFSDIKQKLLCIL